MSRETIEKNGRLYLRDSSTPYPLPVDIRETHRQHLKTLMLTKLYGFPFASPFFRPDQCHKYPKLPSKILEVACGAGLWTSACWDFFKEINHTEVEFHGTDIMHLATELHEQGMKFKYTHHDIRHIPSPFEDESFDFVILKDTSLCDIEDNLPGDIIREAHRLLRKGGVVEIWETDHLVRALQGNPQAPLDVPETAVLQAQHTRTYIVGPTTSFTMSSNPYLKEYNSWLIEAFEDRGLQATPCQSVTMAMQFESDLWTDPGTLKVAVPFTLTSWEKLGRTTPFKSQSGKQAANKDKTSPALILDKQQQSFRDTAMDLVLGFIESINPLLKKASKLDGKEWNEWWDGLNDSIRNKNGAEEGDCLEAGVWWGKKA